MRPPGIAGWRGAAAVRCPYNAVSMNADFRFERRMAVLSVSVGVALLAVKFYAYFLTGSLAIFSDALESIVNVLASGIALYAIILAHAPPDHSHPYGHGKVEFLSAAFEGGMLLLAAAVIAFRGAEQLIRGSEVVRLDIGIALTIVAMVVNGALGWSLVRAGQRGGSIALEADGKHLLGDAITTVGVLTALVLVRLTGRAWIDPVGALVVAAYIALLGWRVLRRAMGGLMDEQDAADDRLIRTILDAHVGRRGRTPQICSYHKLRHRHSGRYHWVDFHVLVPAGWDVSQGHTVASQLEHEIEQALGAGDATAHVEPCIQPECAACDPKERRDDP